MKKIKGFTTIELMISIAIIGILAAIAVPAYQNWKNGGSQIQSSAPAAQTCDDCKTYTAPQ